MNAVMYGGGNIGRGFIGALLSQAGYRVCFVDVVDAVVEALQTRGAYPVRIISAAGHEDQIIENVTAVNGKDMDAAAEAIANADIMATAVGAKILPYIVGNIAEGLRRRFARTDAPLNIIICENLMDADKIFRKLLEEQMSEQERVLLDTRVGFVEASIGRMVPVQTEAMKDGDPLRVCVERYGFLPVDKNAFKGEIPAIRGMIPFAPFDFYIKRKLYLHNMGHAVCAYLGLYTGKECIYESIDDPETLVLTQNAMLQSAEALSKRYGVPYADIKRHIDDLLGRFTNAALGDTCKRVGGDPVRKLAPADRLIGAAHNCMDMGVTPAYICVGVAGGVYQYLRENDKAQSMENAKAALKELSGLADEDALMQLALRFYAMYLDGASVSDIRRAAQAAQREHSEAIV